MPNRINVATDTSRQRDNLEKKEIIREQERKAVEKIADLFRERYGPALKELEKH